MLIDPGIGGADKIALTANNEIYVMNIDGSGIEALTQTGFAVGTADYMSPEQARGTAIDGRADVYALGCVLFAALTGGPPFAQGTVTATMLAHLHDPPPLPSSRGAPHDFDRVIATEPYPPRSVRADTFRGAIAIENPEVVDHKHAKLIVRAGVAGVGVAHDDHRVAGGVGPDELRQLGDVRAAGGQVGVLYQAIKEVKEYLPAYTLRDIIDGVSRNKASSKWNVLNALEVLESTKIFDIRGTPVKELVAAGQCSIINLKGVGPATLATLAEAGVQSFKDLYSASAKRLSHEMKVAQQRIEGWQEQAREASQRLAEEAKTPEGRQKILKESRDMAVEGAVKAQAAAKQAIAYAQKEAQVVQAKAKELKARAPELREKATVALKDAADAAMPCRE